MQGGELKEMSYLPSKICLQNATGDHKIRVGVLYKNDFFSDFF